MTVGTPIPGVRAGHWTHEWNQRLGGRLTVCIGFPGTVVAVDELGASVELDGRVRRASTLVIPDISIGDQVYVTAGTIVERLDPGEAELIRATLLEAIALEEAEAEAAAGSGGLG